MNRNLLPFVMLCLIAIAGCARTEAQLQAGYPERTFSEVAGTIIGAVTVLGTLIFGGYAVLRGIDTNRNKTTEAFNKLMTRLYVNETDAQLHSEVINFVRSNPTVGKLAYDAALQTVAKSNGKSSTKHLALEVGRIHFGSLRMGKRPTIYDEQAIQNDINSRLQ